MLPEYRVAHLLPVPQNREPMKTYIRKCPTCRRTIGDEDLQFLFPYPEETVSLNPYLFCEACITLPLPDGFRILYSEKYTDKVKKSWAAGPPHPRVCHGCTKTISEGMYVFGRVCCKACFEDWIVGRQALLGVSPRGDTPDE